MNDVLEISTRSPLSPGMASVLEPALPFLSRLCREFGPRVNSLLAARQERMRQRDAGEPLEFLAGTRDVREGSWTCAAIPADLQRRHVEITGPVDRKMVINALNSGADVFMADFEDASSPTFENMIEGQRNLRDAVRRTIEFHDARRDKRYVLGDTVATLFVRPRGWHLEERHLLLDGRPVSASLVDFGLFMFHNARELVERGSGPYFYLPKLEHHLEARLWNDAFVYAQHQLGVPRGTIRATVLIETLPAAFQMNEILWELREHSAGLNCGRWDYIFSFIKNRRSDPNALLPDRAEVGMTQPFMRAYTQLVIQTCHRRGVHAMGGMAAQIPIKSDPQENDRAMNKVLRDKEREAADGHDGSWVAHPGLVPIAREVFAGQIRGDHQIHRLREDVSVTAEDLLAVPEGNRTEAGLRENVRVGIAYLEAWLRGNGCVPLNHLMEDAATAEISRAQVWQWQRHGARLDDGRLVDAQLIEQVIEQELDAMRDALGPRFLSGRFDVAANLFERLATAETLADFLTLEAYDLL